MTDFIVVVVLAVILGAAIRYIYKEKKRGVKCIGCPAAGTCSSAVHDHAESGCGCTCDKTGACSGCCDGCGH